MDTKIKEEILNKDLENEATLLKVLGHPTRLKIAYALTKCEANVSNICECLNIPQATISQYISQLKSCDIIKGKRCGNQILYKVYNNNIVRLLDLVYSMNS